MSDLTAQNQAYFDKIADEYDQRHLHAVTELENFVHAQKDFIGIKAGDRLLDYACGTGMVSRALAQEVGEIIGVDLSEKMVGAYNAKARLQGSSRAAYQGNLADPADPNPPALADPKFFNFDVAGVGLGWHHFDNCELATKRLAERLKPGGVLFIIDFAPHEMNPELAAGHGVKHHGFSQQEMQAMFEAAGLGQDFAYDEMAEPINFQSIHGESGSHGQEEEHGGGHGHKHQHGHGHEHGNADGHKHGGFRKVFIARGSKL